MSCVSFIIHYRVLSLRQEIFGVSKIIRWWGGWYSGRVHSTPSLRRDWPVILHFFDKGYPSPQCHSPNDAASLLEVGLQESLLVGWKNLGKQKCGWKEEILRLFWVESRVWEHPMWCSCDCGMLCVMSSFLFMGVSWNYDCSRAPVLKIGGIILQSS